MSVMLNPQFQFEHFKCIVMLFFMFFCVRCRRC